MPEHTDCPGFPRTALLAAALSVQLLVVGACRTPERWREPPALTTSPTLAAGLMATEAKRSNPPEAEAAASAGSTGLTPPSRAAISNMKSQFVSSASARLVPAPETLPLTFEEAIATSLDRNPALVTLRANEPVAHAAWHVAATYPFNPVLQVQVLPYARDSSGDLLGVNHYVWLNQTLELAHQRQYREANAEALWDQVRWNIVQAELANAAQTQRLYFAAIYQHDLLELAAEAARLNLELNEIVDRRFQAGLSTAAEQSTARIAARQSQRQLELATATWQASDLALQRQMNLEADEPFALVGRLDEFEWLPVPGMDMQADGEVAGVFVSGEALSTLANNRPDVLAAHAGAGAAQASADLARANQTQNLGIGPFYERDESGTVFAGFRVQGNLPVWDTGRPLTAQREAEHNLQMVTLHQLQLRARTEAQTAIERYERARRVAKRRPGPPSNLPGTELDQLKDQFESGQADILNVFAVQAALLQERRAALDLLNEVAQAAADVTLMAGLPPACLVSHQGGGRPAGPPPAPGEGPGL